MKKFNKPEIELIVLDNTDICTASVIGGVVDQAAKMLNYNGRGPATLKAPASYTADLVDYLEDELE